MQTYWLLNKIVSRVILHCIPQVTEIKAYDDTNLNSYQRNKTEYSFCIKYDSYN